MRVNQDGESVALPPDVFVAQDSPELSPQEEPLDLNRTLIEQDSSTPLIQPVSTQKSNLDFVLYGVFLLFAAVGNSYFFKRQVDAFTNYAYFLANITTVVYVPVFYALVLYQIKFTKSITPAMRQFPKKKFFIMGALDGLSGIFMTFGGVHTTGSLQALLLQGLIPITMALAFIILKERYSRYQYVGAMLIVIGVIVSLLPSVTEKSTTSNVLGWNMLFLISVIPQAASSVFKEIAFCEAMDINYLQLWVAAWQFLFGMILAPINTLSILGPAAVSLSGIPSTFYNGFRCMLGHNTLEGDACSGAWIPLVCYLVFNLLYNISITLVIKHGGANLMNFVMTLRLPILQVVFALPFLPHPEQFHWLSLVGLAVILCGLSAYRYSNITPLPDCFEENVSIFPGAMEVPAFTLRRKAPSLLLRGPQTIRSGFYGRLGISASDFPGTPQFRRTFLDPYKRQEHT